ncbi:MAG: hypothetical protein GYB26_10975 [Gammaproteobacteria bacterium]|uniref:Tetratricopeptide repeat protein n=1 Tax=Marinobacter litoralis TaxID=187981 RepID=A0A3M2RCU0_9GAMM|nr:hypothetical protein [Marinobacter litoralis]MBR9871653.1 hypothetical protein [Gammaproteobacteria bacterium]RMJ02984.1 hypothetical protein DOQ08_02449 [Marinobacter litoralis]
MWFIDNRFLKPALAIAIAGTLVGCASGPKVYDRAALAPAEQSLVNSKPAPLRADFQNLFEEGTRNKVLNLMEIGVKAYRSGFRDEAKNTLTQARLEIENVYADTDSARKARSIWYEEAEKDFKGEPYERAMVYFYLGLIYLEEGDYGNARASFLAGLLQDAFAEEEQNSTDFALLLYLAGWSALQMGSEQLAEQHFEELKLYRPDAPIPDLTDNALLIVETGHSPRKLGDGVGHYQLVYRRGKNFKDIGAEFRNGEQWSPVYPMEDIFFQASTRGGRAIDRIVEGQIQFKENTRAVGSTLSSVSQNSMLAGAGAAAGGVIGAGFAAVSLISVAADGLSASANTRADIRYWAGIPDTVHVMPVTATDGQAVTVRFLDEYGRPIHGLNDSTAFKFDGRGAGLAFATSRRPNQGSTQ